MAKDNLDMMRESHLEESVWDSIFDLPTPEHRLSLSNPALDSHTLGDPRAMSLYSHEQNVQLGLS